MSHPLSRPLTLALALLLAAPLARAADSTQPWPAPVPGFVPPAPGEHPRLFFRKADVPLLKERAQTAEGKAIVQRLRFLLNGSDGESLPAKFNPTRADKEGSGDFHKQAKDGEAYTLWHGAGYGMLFQLTGDAKHAKLGQECVQKALDGQRDRDDRYAFIGPHGALRAGPSIGAIAMAYDLCYDGWDESFRTTVAKALAEYNQGANENLPNLALGKRHGPHSNHWGPQIGGGAMALLAIKGDPGVDDAKLKPLLDGNAKTFVRHMTDGFGDGGYFNEHAGPGQIGSDTAFVPAVQAWRVAGGLDFVTPRKNVPSITLIRCYELLRDAKGQTTYMIRHPSSYGSGAYPEDRNGLSRGGQFAQGFGAVTDEQKPAVLWVYNHIVEPAVESRTYDTVSPYPHRAVLALVNWPIGVAERNPAEVLPRVHHDTIKNYVVFRNRWQDHDDILVSGLWGGRNDGIEPVMVWGLGEKLTWYQCAKTGDGVGKSELVDTRPDGSGVIRAGTQWVVVDFSRKSGADALLLMTGPGSSASNRRKPADPAAPVRKGASQTLTVTVNGVPVDVLTLSKGEHPPVRVEGDKIVVGDQTVTLEGGKLVLAK